MHSGRIRWAIVVVLALWGSSQAFAVWDKYSPFRPGKVPKQFSQVLLTMKRHGFGEEGPLFLEFFRGREASACLRIDWGDYDSHISIRSADGSVRFNAPIFGSLLCDAEATCADLNRDGVADFIVVTHSGGNGLAAQITTITFLLSSPDGYVARPISSFDAAPADLVDLNDDGRPEFVHCMCVWGDKGKDGRAHNYWVYNLIGFSGTTLISANATSREFPKWIAYTHAENHEDSTQLTAAQRQRQWLSTWQNESINVKAIPFPDVEAFALEQGRTITPNR